MLKKVSLFFNFMFCVNIVCAQKSFEITIRLDSSIIPQNVHYSYYDGKIYTFPPDTFGSKREVVLKSTYYSSLVSFNVSYTDPVNKNHYSNEFFIDDKPATISFYAKANPANKLKYTSIKNALPIYDTIANKSWARLHHFLIDTAMSKENEAFDDFLSHHKGFSKNDSLTRIFNKFYKARLNRIMLFLRQYPDDYFSFWYFINQVAQVNNVLEQDKDYLKDQLAYLKAVFPPRFIESVEGRELIKTYEISIDPLKLNAPAPSFTITTIDRKNISLNDLKGKYVLLDFWATWCPPCLAEIPFIKDIRKNYPADKLAIIGVSQDRDLRKLTEAIDKEKMNWTHFFDQRKQISQLYGIGEFPTLILINKEGHIIYKSDSTHDDKKDLSKILESLKISI